MSACCFIGVDVLYRLNLKWHQVQKNLNATRIDSGGLEDCDMPPAISVLWTERLAGWYKRSLFGILFVAFFLKRWFFVFFFNCRQVNCWVLACKEVLTALGSAETNSIHYWLNVDIIKHLSNKMSKSHPIANAERLGSEMWGYVPLCDVIFQPT